LAALFVVVAIAAGGTWALLLTPVKVQVAKTEHNVPIQVESIPFNLPA